MKLVPRSSIFLLLRIWPRTQGRLAPRGFLAAPASVIVRAGLVKRKRPVAISHAGGCSPEADGPERGAAEAGHNRPQPVRGLRDWLDHLAARDRLAVAHPGVALRFELAAIAKRLDGQRATLFPRPGGHRVPVVSGLVSSRAWIAEAIGVEPAEMLTHFERA